MIALASALFRCHRLRRLDVSHSNITSVGLKALLKGLKHAKVREVYNTVLPAVFDHVFVCTVDVRAVLDTHVISGT